MLRVISTSDSQQSFGTLKVADNKWKDVLDAYRHALSVLHNHIIILFDLSTIFWLKACNLIRIYVIRHLIRSGCMNFGWVGWQLE